MPGGVVRRWTLPLAVAVRGWSCRLKGRSKAILSFCSKGCDMIELTKILIERLIPPDVIKDIISFFRRNKTADLGADIFGVYHNLNMIYITAEELLGEMDSAVRADDVAQAEARSPQLRRHYDIIFRLVCQQARQLSKVKTEYVSLDEKIHLMDRASYVVIEKFFGGKFNLFSDLDQVLTPSSEARLNGPRAALVLANEHGFIETTQRRHVDDLGPHADEDRRLFAHIESEIERFASKLSEKGAIASLHPEMIVIFRRYLAGGAREALDSIQSALNQFYEAIRTNFSVEDLLLKVGDKRMRSFEIH
jgi:hypothetical protein